jgi:hypothetical protein
MLADAGERPCDDVDVVWGMVLALLPIEDLHLVMD